MRVGVLPRDLAGRIINGTVATIGWAVGASTILLTILIVSKGVANVPGGSMVAAAGGRYLVRGGKAEGREGAPPAGRVIILEYPSFEAAKEFLESPEYAEIIHLRTDNTRSRLMVVEGMVP